MSYRFAVIGGDARQVKLARLLSYNHTVTAFGLDEMPPEPPVQYTQSIEEAVALCDCVVLPIPLLQRDGLLNMPLMVRALPFTELADSLQAGQTLAAGMIPPDARETLEAKGLHVIDYAKREELAIKNAVPTAEAALQIAMERMSMTIDGCRALVIGYGRIGKLLATMLRNLGASVSVSARKLADLTWIEINGCRALHSAQLAPYLSEFDVIFNTVPHAILTEKALQKVAKHCLLIDLASAPGGIDLDAAKRNGNPCIWALALPGKHSPDTAAANLCDTLQIIMDETRAGL